MKLISSAFENGEKIPTRFTCEGEDISPPLSWEGVPENTQVLALVVDDPDAPSGSFTHWIVYNIPVTPPKLGEGASLRERFSEGLREGFNNFGNQGYGGPCPPRGHSAHRYYFRLYALEEPLKLTGRVTKAQLYEAMQDKIIDETALLGRYARE